MATWTFNPDNFVQETDGQLTCNGCDWEAQMATKPSVMTPGEQMTDKVASGMMALRHLQDSHGAATADADWSKHGTRWTAHEKV